MFSKLWPKEFSVHENSKMGVLSMLKLIKTKECYHVLWGIFVQFEAFY